VIGFADIVSQFTSAGRPVCINAQSGRQTAEGLRLLGQYWSQGLIKANTSIVMALGTNDVLDPPNVMRTEVESAVRTVGPAHQVYWVHVFNYWAASSVPQSYFIAGTRRVSDEINWVAMHYGNLTTVRWPALVLASSYPSLLLADLTHPTRGGSQVRTALILNTIKSREARL
jgi:lysophospholipase L1-like esterase